MKEKVLSKYEIVARAYVPLESLTVETFFKAAHTSASGLFSSWDPDHAQLQEKFGMSQEEIDEDEENGTTVNFEYEVKRLINDFIYDYKKWKFPLTLYRALCVKSLDTIKFDKLGTDWTHDEDSADCYHGFRAKKGSKVFVLKTQVKKTDIDWVGTLWNNLSPSFGEDEKEVNLIPGKKVKVIEVEENGQWVKVNKPGSV